MKWYKLTKLTVTLSIEAESEDDAIAKFDSGRWEANQPNGYDVEIDMEAPPYEGPEEDPDA